MPLIKRVKRFTGRITAVTAEAIFTAKREPMPENAERKMQLKGFPDFTETARIITAHIIKNEKNM